MKFLRTIRFDPSDAQVFENAAEPGEWAVSGGFAFAHLAPDAIGGKTRQAFANGFLGLASCGRSTFASVSAMTAEEREAALDALAAHLVAHYGAPDKTAARGVAEEECDFIADLVAEQPVNRVFAVRRSFDENGEIREEFRIVTPPSGKSHTRIWEIVEDDA
jgi:hypothetical protein